MKTKKAGRFKGLFWKLLSVSILCIVIPMLVSLFTASYFSTKYLSDSASNALANIAAEKKNQFELALYDIEKQAQSIAMQPYIVDALNWAINNNTDPNGTELQVISKILQDNFELSNGLFENMYLMYKNKVVADGIGGASIGWENDVVGSAESMLIRDPTVSPTTGRPAMVIVAPIQNNKHLGTIGMAIELNSVSEKIIDSETSLNDLKTMIIFSSGLVIGSTDPDYVLSLNFQDQESGLQDFFNKIVSEKTGVSKFTLDGVDYISAYSDSSKYGMYILTYMPVAVYEKNTVSLEIILITVILISMILASVVIYITIKKIVKPVLATAKQAEQLANWDLSISIPESNIKRKDELGKLAKSFNVMVQNLKSIIKQIIDAAEHVAASSEELYASGDQVGKAAEEVASMILGIASGAEEQSAQIDSALLNLNDLIKQIDEVNTSSDKMEKTTMYIMEDISKGNKSVSDSVDMINNLETDTEAVSKVISDLGNSSNQIGQINELISGIADQTNLLALNAAIEAARAGDAGKGFSVLADEIRKLAEGAADASRKIANLTVQIENDVETAINKMDGSISSVHACVKSIEENGVIFTEINEQAKQLKEIVYVVAQSVKTMAERSADFESTMREINEASRVFAANSEGVSASAEEQIALTEEIAAASKAMATISEELSSLVRKFKL
jgi:methyl-accepting chemotaxis protein